jgi:hypothetical protein
MIKRWPSDGTNEFSEKMYGENRPVTNIDEGFFSQNINRYMIIKISRHENIPAAGLPIPAREEVRDRKSVV